MSSQTAETSRSKQKPAPDRAEFTVKEKPVKLEKIPELEAELGKAGKAGKPAAQGIPAGEGQAQPPPEAPAFRFEDIGPVLQLAGDKWNDYLQGPPTDEKGRYLWTSQDTKNIVTALTLLDQKYHFSADWMQYWPEVFSLIVIGGIIAKLVMGARWKDKQKKQETAQEEHPTPGPSQSVQPAAAKPASEKTPLELQREAEETLKKFNVQS